MIIKLVFMNIKKHFLQKKHLSLIFIYLFLSSIFAQKVHAKPILWSIENNIVIFIFSLLCGFLVATMFYFNNSADREKIVSSRNLVSSLLEDFWFDEFIILRFTTFLYFLSISFFWAYLIFNGLLFMSGKSYYATNLLIAPIYLIIFRFLLETTIAIFKIAENTKISSKEN